MKYLWFYNGVPISQYKTLKYFPIYGCKSNVFKAQPFHKYDFKCVTVYSKIKCKLQNN